MRFASAKREELWVRGTRLESRTAYGEAVAGADGVVEASDLRDDALVAACEASIEGLRAAAAACAEFTVRLVAEASTEGHASLMVVNAGSYSVVTAPEWLESDLAVLRDALARGREEPVVAGRDVPILWRNGSGAVLLHEAAGHAAEHGHPPLDWPRWLSVRDGEADLLAGQPPVSLRRASFRDAPLRRMREIRASQHDAPWEPPRRRIEVLLVDGGTYEPLTGEVAIGVAHAHFVDEDAAQPARRVAPFALRESRAAIAHSLAGAAGPPLRYPGVICSREGQERFVASWAPLMLTVFR